MQLNSAGEVLRKSCVERGHLEVDVQREGGASGCWGGTQGSAPGSTEGEGVLSVSFLRQQPWGHDGTA